MTQLFRLVLTKQQRTRNQYFMALEFHGPEHLKDGKRQIVKVFKVILTMSMIS